MYITIMYYYYFNLHVMHFLHLYKYYYVLCNIIYYILLLFFHFVHLYLYIPKRRWKG